MSGGASARAGGQQARVLVVDDDPTTIDVLVALLSPRYRVAAARNGEAALRIAFSSEPDLILLDAMMPGMDGFEVAGRLRGHQRTSQVPVIFLTSLDRAEDEVRAFEAGAVDFISKPIVAAVVSLRVATHLELQERRRQAQALNRSLSEANALILAERARADGLLRNVLPRRIIQDLLTNGHSEPELFPEVSVVFTDIVDFTGISGQVEPRRLIGALNEVYSAFDGIIASHNGERIKTIGDAYMAVCGMPDRDPDHAANVVAAALEFVEYCRQRNEREAGVGGLSFLIRAGVHSGAAVGGIVGTAKFIYDVFGDTINVAARVQQLSEPMRVNVSEATRLLVPDGYHFEDRGPLSVKGKGELRMFFARGPGPQPGLPVSALRVAPPPPPAYAG
jgi:class 3 adenylate cyclase